MLFLLLWNFVNKKKPILKKTSKTKEKENRKTSDELDVSKTSNFCEEIEEKRIVWKQKKKRKEFWFNFSLRKVQHKKSNDLWKSMCEHRVKVCEGCINERHPSNAFETNGCVGRTHIVNWLIERIFNRLRKFRSFSIDHVNASLLFGSSWIRSAWTVVWK